MTVTPIVFAQVNARAREAGLSLWAGDEIHGNRLCPVYHVYTVDHATTGYSIEIGRQHGRDLYRARHDEGPIDAPARVSLGAAFNDVLRHRHWVERRATAPTARPVPWEG